MLVLLDEDPFARSSRWASLDRKDLKFMYGLLGNYSWRLHELGSWFGLDKNSGKSQETIKDIRNTLSKRISALELAEEVGNDVEHV